MALITCSPLYLQARHRSYHFYVNLENPEDTQRHVEEDLERLAEENKHDTTAYLHSLLNLSLSYYQAKDFVKAREIAEYTHQRALQHNAKSSLIYLTATTCSRCAGALAEEYEQHVAYMEEQAAVSVSLAPKPSVVFSAQRAIRKLKEDALRYDGIAQRTYQRPDLAFMRGGAGGRAQKHGQRPRADQRRHWQEDGNNVDEEYQDTYGERWQARRTRPEHTEVKRQCQRAQSPTSKYKVPK